MRNVYWVDRKGNVYGPFSVQEDGFPNAGEVVQFYRARVQMSRANLAQLLNTSRRWITKMEKENAVPEMISRRKAIAQVLSIPPILLGIGVVGQDNFLGQMGASHIDTTPHLDGYVDHLNSSWDLSFAIGGTTMLPSILERRESLKAVVAQGGIDTKKALSILNRYEQFLLVVGREQGSPFSPTDVVDTAQESGEVEAIAASLLRRGKMFYEREDLVRARADILKGLAYARKSGSQVHGWGVSIAAQVLAGTAKDVDDVEEVLHLLDEARRYIDSTEPDTYRLQFNQDRYPIIRAEALIPLLRIDPGIVDEVFSALDEADRLIKPQFLRRKAHLDLSYAQASLYGRDAMGAVSAAFSSLELSKAIGSKRNVKAIVKIYRELEAEMGGTTEHKALGRLLSSTK